MREYGNDKNVEYGNVQRWNVWAWHIIFVNENEWENMPYETQMKYESIKHILWKESDDMQYEIWGKLKNVRIQRFKFEDCVNK